MERQRLEERRWNQTQDLVWLSPGGEEHRFTVCVGFYQDNTAGEVFAHGPKEGSTLLSVIHDACVLASNLRQRGVTFRHLAERMGADGEAFVSPIGAVLGCAAEMEEGEETFLNCEGKENG